MRCSCGRLGVAGNVQPQLRQAACFVSTKRTQRLVPRRLHRTSVQTRVEDPERIASGGILTPALERIKLLPYNRAAGQRSLRLFRATHKQTRQFIRPCLLMQRPLAHRANNRMRKEVWSHSDSLRAKRRRLSRSSSIRILQNFRMTFLCQSGITWTSCGNESLWQRLRLQRQS